MTDRSKYSEFPSQIENRKQWIIDTVRNNQQHFVDLIFALTYPENARISGGDLLRQMHKHDQDALLLPNGILTDVQIEILSPGRLSQDTEADQ